MKETMKFRSYILLFSVAIFILTALGLAYLYYKTLVLPFWFALAYIVAWAWVFASAADFFVGNGKLSGKKFLLLTFGVMIISTTVTHSVWTIVTPRWSFSVTTDKSSYNLGEDVQIIVSLENLGFIEHSFKSAVNIPFVVSVEMVHDNPTLKTQVWYSPCHPEATKYTLSPHQSLERTFTWNQTNTVNPWFWNQTYTPGTYLYGHLHQEMHIFLTKFFMHIHT